jgi:hypothetical protein
LLTYRLGFSKPPEHPTQIAVSDVPDPATKYSIRTPLARPRRLLVAPQELRVSDLEVLRLEAQ